MRAAVLGSPIAHSLSPQLHRAAYAHLGLDWTYERIECDEAGLASRLDRLAAAAEPAYAGVSLTMPLKSAALGLVDAADGVARDAAAVNTVVFHDGRRSGANTDVPGLVAALAERRVPAPADAALLGAGATARSALVALAVAGCQQVTAYVRRPDAAGPLRDTADRCGLALVVADWRSAGEALHAQLVVSTVPAGVTDRLAGEVPPAPGALLDVVYRPWPTALAARWADRGGTVVGGLDLLVHQAALQVQLMTRCRASAEQLVAVMRPAGEAALGR